MYPQTISMVQWLMPIQSIQQIMLQSKIYIQKKIIYKLAIDENCEVYRSL